MNACLSARFPRFTLVTVALFLLLGSSAALPEDTVTVEFYPLVGKKGPPIIAQYQGRRYQPPRSLEAASATDLELAEERFVLHMVNIIRRGTIEQFIGLWESRDQKEVRQFYSTKRGLWEKLQRHYNLVTDMRLVNLMHYGKYSLVQVLKLPPKLQPYVSTVVLEHTRAGLRLSNDLEGDAVHAYFATEFATRLVEEYNAGQRARDSGKK